MNARLCDVLDRFYPGFLTCHVLVETPEQVTDLYTVLLDGAKVLRFELPRTAEPEPLEVETFSVDQFRQMIGQGKFQLMLDRAIQDYLHAYADAR
ncbi:hypothetical protein [Brevundimonas sp.]|uniref:hypothetical protein n=1 Tax=Brevundimonas sp. TaxID=1871086 RepID=UPI003D6D1A3B